MKKALLLCVLAVVTATGCEKGTSACTPEIEKKLEKEGYIGKVRRDAVKACNSGSLGCAELSKYASDVESCYSELTH